MFSSMTVYASEPASPEKPEFLRGLSAETAEWYGRIDTNYNEVEEIVVGEFYAERYKDLKLAYGFDEEQLTNHFWDYGLSEGRLASPVLDVLEYSKMYPDLQLVFGNDWDKYAQHYFQYGILEGRDNGTDFKPEIYLSMYPDLQAAFGDNSVAATIHYLEYGYAEGREYQFATPSDAFQPSYSTERYELEDGSSVHYEYDENTGVLLHKLDYYADGSLSHEIQYYDTGIIYIERIYGENGAVAKEWEYDSDGNLISETLFDENGNYIP